jgi:hypothetical protein
MRLPSRTPIFAMVLLPERNRIFDLSRPRARVRSDNPLVTLMSFVAERAASRRLPVRFLRPRTDRSTNLHLR